MEDRVLTGLNQAEATGPAKAAPRARTQTAYTSEELLERILQSLDDDKGEDIVQIDLRGKSSIGDYMVVASGRSTRQVSAMAEKLVDKLKQDFGLYSKIEGKDTGDWVLIDTADVIVHIFRPEVREFYQLEKIWQPEASRGLKVHLCVVGRLKKGPEKALIDDYLQRFDKTGRGLGLSLGQVIEVEDRKGAGMAGEAELIRARLPGATFWVMDERGEVMTSPTFADRLGAQRDRGMGDLVLVIGGADGIDPGLRAEAAMAVSFGKMVWPHMLARVMLCEQLYRAASILAGSPYHRA